MNSEINPNMIVLARESRGQTQQDLAEKIKLHRANVSRLEKGETNVHDETLTAISAATCYPPKFFTQAVIPVNLAYRKRQPVPIKVLTPIEAKMNIIRKTVQFVTGALDKDVPKLPAMEVTTDKCPSIIAGLIRERWNVAEGIINDLTRIIENQGVIISAFDFGTERVDSRSMFTDDKYPIIFVNKKLLGDRLRYSLAYELGQLIMHTFSSIPPERDISKEANEFAAALLMPENAIRKDLENGITLSLLAKLKRKWKVSMISILYRADDLGLLTLNQKRYLIQQFNEQKIRRREPMGLDVPVEKPALLKNLINYFIREYEIGIKELLPSSLFLLKITLTITENVKMKNATKNTDNNMSTTNYVVEIRPYSLTKLSRLYGISNGIMKRWLAPHTEVIGGKVGRLYNTLHVKIIFEKLGLPGKAED